MSVFRTTTVTCPACSAGVEFEAVHSVNADRRPDLRDDILNRAFQRGTCAKCSKTFRLDPEFVYLDVGRSQWIAAFPLERLADFEAAEQQARTTFDLAFGDAAEGPAKEVGDGLVPRVVFGWAALREKIVVAENDLDDVVLEIVKIALVRSLGELSLSNATELRLIGVKDDELLLAWLDSREETIVEALGVPLEVYQANAADLESWQAIHSQLAGRFFVDMQRLMMESAAPAGR